MSRIKILPEILSNKIAAGEVVERPASVVKELVENAIDAGSTQILIEIERGGRALIRISDNGCGMSHDDALLSLERYATSKIAEDRDLFDIRTLGFRGEALPSIASVSKFTMVTREQKADSGVRISVEGGRITHVTEVGAPSGTMIDVAQLFYNTPARRKFLKSVETETGHIADIVSSVALGWPSIRFRLVHNGREVKTWPAVEDPADRVAVVLGGNIKAELLPLTPAAQGVQVSGWIATPAVTRSTSQKIFMYVNGRFIKDRGLQHALFEGYRGRLMKGRFPVAVIFIRVPFDELDVNVHPTKHEVRFSDFHRVHTAMKSAVMAAWEQVDRPRHRRMDSPLHSPDPKPLSTGYPVEHRQGPAAVSEEQTDYGRPLDLPKQEPTPAVQSFIPEKETPPEQKFLWDTNQTEDIKVIGQLHNSYIVCQSSEGMMLMDQHAAHERVLFEQIRTRVAAGNVPVQRLLMAEMIELGFKEADALTQMMPILNQLGLEIEPFGGNTFAVKGVPAIMADHSIGPLISELAEKAIETGLQNASHEAWDELLQLMACHGAIRANHRMSEQEMKTLIHQLDQCETPSNCPHGRPVWLRWSLGELEKAFKR